jgi:hypothetical protein
MPLLKVWNGSEWIIVGNATAVSGPGTGSVTSVGLSMPSIFAVSGSPVTTAGTFGVTLATQAANRVWAGPATGADATPTFRALVDADIPVAIARTADLPANLPPSGAAGGDLAGTYPNPTVDGLQGRAVASTAPTNNQVLRWVTANSRWEPSTIGGVGTVTSVGLTMPAGHFVTSNTPVTESGTLTVAWASQAANRVLAGPASGINAAPTFRALVDADIPASIARDAELPTTLPPSGAAGGDLDGTYPDPDVVALRGYAVHTAAPDDGDVLIWVAANSRYEPGPMTGGGGSGTVTSVALALPGIFSVGGSPVTTSGTLTATVQDANTVWAGPASGADAAPTFRLLVEDDIPVEMARVADLPASLPPSGTAGGDLSGTYPNPTVDAIQGYAVHTTAPGDGQVLRWVDANSRYEPYTPTAGTVTSVGLTAPGIFSVGGSPVTTAGTLALTLATQAANLVWAGPTSGGAATPTFRTLVDADIPASIARDAELPTSLPPSGTAGGDLAGTYPNPTVDAIQGYAVHTTAPDDGDVLIWVAANSRYEPSPASGSGTVTSVALALPGIFSISGSPVTTSGTLTATLAVQDANTVWAGPTSGADAAPTFRLLVDDDIPVELARVADLPASLPPSGTAGGDLSGTYPNPTVDAIQGYAVHTTAPGDGQVLRWVDANSRYEPYTPTAGTVTSVGLTAPGIFSVGGSPVTTAGTLALTLATQAANLVWAGPTSGGAAAPTFRALVANDIPTVLNTTGIRGSPSGVAAGLAVSWQSGDAMPTMYVGSGNSSNNQTALYVESYSGVGLVVTSANGSAIFGYSSGGTGISFSSYGSYASDLKAFGTNSGVQQAALYSAATLSGPTVSGFGVGIVLSAMAPDDADQHNIGQIAAIYTHATAIDSALLFYSTLANTLTERARITSGGAFLIGKTSGLAGAGDLDIAGHFQMAASKRIIGDFSNATFASRTLFQDATTNTGTNIGIIPNGTAVTSALIVYNGSDPDNAGRIAFNATSTIMQLSSNKSGTGTVLPLGFYMSGSEVARFATTGAFLIGKTTGLDGLGDLDIAGLFKVPSVVNAITIGTTAHASTVLTIRNGLTTMYGATIEADTSGRGVRLITSDWVNNTTGTMFIMSFGAGTGNTSTQLMSRATGGSSATSLVLQPSNGYVYVGKTSGLTGTGDLDVLGTINGDKLIRIAMTSGSTGYGLRWWDGTSDWAAFQALNSAGTTAIFFSVNRHFDGSAWQQLNTRVGGSLLMNTNGLNYFNFAASSSTPVLAFQITQAAGVMSVLMNDATTATAPDVIISHHNTSGLVANNFGSGMRFMLASDTTDSQSASVIQTIWATAAHATRKARVMFYVYDTAAREAIRIQASGTAPMIGLFGVTAVARPSVTGVSSGTPTAAQQAAVIRSILLAGESLGAWVDSTT